MSSLRVRHWSTGLGGAASGKQVPGFRFDHEGVAVGFSDGRKRGPRGARSAFATAGWMMSRLKRRHAWTPCQEGELDWGMRCHHVGLVARRASSPRRRTDLGARRAWTRRLCLATVQSAMRWPLKRGRREREAAMSPMSTASWPRVIEVETYDPE